MEPIKLEYFDKEFNRLQDLDPVDFLSNFRKEGFTLFNDKGLPTQKNEEWKYSGPVVSNLFKKQYQLAEDKQVSGVSKADVDQMRLPGFENANEVVFVNGKF